MAIECRVLLAVACVPLYGIVTCVVQLPRGYGMEAAVQWSNKMMYLVHRFKHLTATTLMISTLGGAYSALGDQSFSRSLQVGLLLLASA